MTGQANYPAARAAWLPVSSPAGTYRPIPARLAQA